MKATHPTQDLTVTGKLGPRLPSLNPTPFQGSPFSQAIDFPEPAGVTQSLPALLLGYLGIMHADTLRLQYGAHMCGSECTPSVFPFPPCLSAWLNSRPC